ncbi:MAG TPA: hypothetical protein VM328_06620 [Fimbriimonadaceae bacterium]|nr:hypothetical protein [Fimbriimonadaceae bacterium]
MSDWTALSSRYGGAGESEAYRLVADLYDQDRVEEAFEQARALGVGTAGRGLTWYRLLEAEAITRQRATRHRINEWLEVEAIEAELPVEPLRLGQDLAAHAESVAARLQAAERPPVLVTIFSEEVDAPWTPNRQGFCEDKTPYAKICLPRSAVLDPYELPEAMRHEYAHVAVLVATADRCPRWLDEAVAMTMGGGADEREARDFARGAVEWLQPKELDQAFLEDREDPEGREEVWLAYQQSAWIGRYLVETAGQRGLAGLLAAFGNNSRWTDLKMLITGQEPADEALREVYGFGIDELFRRSLEWLRSR